MPTVIQMQRTEHKCSGAALGADMKADEAEVWCMQEAAKAEERPSLHYGTETQAGALIWWRRDLAAGAGGADSVALGAGLASVRVLALDALGLSVLAPACSCGRTSLE